jgi:hypothetical protein
MMLQSGSPAACGLELGRLIAVGVRSACILCRYPHPVGEVIELVIDGAAGRELRLPARVVKSEEMQEPVWGTGLYYAMEARFGEEHGDNAALVLRILRCAE